MPVEGHGRLLGLIETTVGLLQMGKRIAQLRTRQDVLLPMLPAQEILP